MSKAVEIVLKATPEIAKALENKNMTEIFIRGCSGKCEMLKKCIISRVEKDSGVMAKKALQGMAQSAVGTNTADLILNGIQFAVDMGFSVEQSIQLNQIKKKLVTMEKYLKKMEGIEWLNVGLEVANLAATAISAAMIYEKIDQIGKQIEKVEKEIAEVRDIQFESTFRKPCKELIQNYKIIKNDSEKGKKLDAEELEKNIKHCDSILDSAINMLKKNPREDMLEIIFSLLPIFTDLIIMYYKSNYDPNDGKHVLHADWMQTYQVMTSKKMMESTRDYLILEQNRHYSESDEIVQCQTMLVQSQLLQIEETLYDLETCGGAEEYREIEKMMDETMKQFAAYYAEALKDKAHIENAEEIVQEALNEVIVA